MGKPSQPRARSRSRSRSRDIISKPVNSVKRERRASRSRSRGRSTVPKTEALTDWVWQNVTGKAESTARQQRSRSRSRNSRKTEMGKMIPPVN